MTDGAGPQENREQTEPDSKDVQAVTQPKGVDDDSLLKRKASDEPAAGADEAAASKKPRGQPAQEAAVAEERKSSGGKGQRPRLHGAMVGDWPAGA